LVIYIIGRLDLTRCVKG